MTVFVLERVRPGARGQLTRWMLEVQAGVFVGTLSARVRQLLWDMICQEARRPPAREAAPAAALLIHSAPTEQGFEIAAAGDMSRSIVDLDGLLLVCRSAAGDGDGKGTLE